MAKRRGHGGVRHGAGGAEKEVRTFTEDRRAGFFEFGPADLDETDVGLHLRWQQRIFGGHWVALVMRRRGPSLDEHHALARRAGAGRPDHQAGGSGRHAGEQEGLVAVDSHVGDFRITHRQRV